jgi:hypothetical protein
MWPEKHVGTHVKIGGNLKSEQSPVVKTLAPQARSLRDSFGGEICTYCLISIEGWLR